MDETGEAALARARTEEHIRNVEIVELLELVGRADEAVAFIKSGIFPEQLRRRLIADSKAAPSSRKPVLALVSGAPGSVAAAFAARGMTIA